MSDDTYDQFKTRYEAPDDAAGYRDKRFTRSRHWRWVDRREQAVVRRFLESLPPSSAAVDIPCGAGRLAPLFNQTGVRYVGADVALAMVQLARRTLGQGADVVAADALALPFADRAFDALVSVRLLHRIHHRETRAAMLREMARVVRGPLLVSYYTRWNLRGLRKWLSGRFPGLAVAAIRQDARQAGLRIARTIPLRRLTNQQCFFVLERAAPSSSAGM